MDQDLEYRFTRAMGSKNESPIPVEKSDWILKIIKSILDERRETEKKHGIRIGQTEIYCVRCTRPCWPGNHVCKDIQLQDLHQKKRIVAEQNEPLIDKIKVVGRSRVAIFLKLPQGTVSHWIARRNIPERYRDEIRAL